jgi:hypothetical protein
MSYTIHIKETNVATVTFNTKEEAEEWMKEPDYDLVTWYDCIESDFTLEENKDETF